MSATWSRNSGDPGVCRGNLPSRSDIVGADPIPAAAKIEATTGVVATR